MDCDYVCDKQFVFITTTLAYDIYPKESMRMFIDDSDIDESYDEALYRCMVATEKSGYKKFYENKKWLIDDSDKIDFICACGNIDRNAMDDVIYIGQMYRCLQYVPVYN